MTPVRPTALPHTGPYPTTATTIGTQLGNTIRNICATIAATRTSGPHAPNSPKHADRPSVSAAHANDHPSPGRSARPGTSA